MSSKHITNKQGKCFSHRKCREMRKTLPGKVFTVYLFLKIAFTHKIKVFLMPMSRQVDFYFEGDK